MFVLEMPVPRQIAQRHSGSHHRFHLEIVAVCLRGVTDAPFHDGRSWQLFSETKNEIVFAISLAAPRLERSDQCYCVLQRCHLSLLDVFASLVNDHSPIRLAQVLLQLRYITRMMRHRRAQQTRCSRKRSTRSLRASARVHSNSADTLPNRSLALFHPCTREVARHCPRERDRT